MEEKCMVNDILTDSKNSIKSYAGAIVETSNMELRSTFQNLRNSLETFQYDLYKVAESKGYYMPAEMAKQEEIDKVKNDLNIN